MKGLYSKCYYWWPLKGPIGSVDEIRYLFVFLHCVNPLLHTFQVSQDPRQENLMNLAALDRLLLLRLEHLLGYVGHDVQLVGELLGRHRS